MTYIYSTYRSWRLNSFNNSRTWDYWGEAITFKLCEFIVAFGTELIGP